MYKHSDTCLEKSADDEPIFVLVARDKLAVRAIESWIRHASRNGVSREKIVDAMRVANAMIDWQRAHGSHIPD